MTTRKYSSRSQQTTLTGAITSGATSMTVVSGTALLGGVTIPAGQTFTLVIDVDTALEEIVDATAVSTNTFTITRAIDGSTAQDHSAGAVVRHMAIGRDYRDANLHAEADASYNDGGGNAHTMHGIGAGEGVVVGTLKTQTLTNKTLTAPVITNPSITGAGVDASIVFEGTTADAFETTLTVVDPTQDNTITLPNTTGTVVIATATQTLTNKTLTSPVISGSPVITGLSSAGMVSSSATPKDYVDSILGSATAAATSAASAATSAASAATSASSASTSASSALTSANSASTSATAAATSAASAATSATAASTSASSALTSASSASTSASSAATSASSASTSASSALTSANSASTSATASASSASASATSATAAATSATSAAASATAAATSATSAAASATAAATSATSAAASATTAANSASAAATSATSAAASATAAATSETNAAASATAAATSASSASTSASSALTSANSASTSAASAATSASSAAASFDSFDDRYLGPKASAPTTDNDGNPLTSGVLYYNTTSGVMFVYNGNTSAWEQVAVSTSGFPTLAGNNNFTGLNTFTNAGTADVLRVTNTGTGNSLVVEDSSNPDSSPFVVDPTGTVIAGYTTAAQQGSTKPLIQIQGTDNSSAGFGVFRYSNDTDRTRIILAKSRGAIGSQGAVASGDVISNINAFGSDGTNWAQASGVSFEVDGTVSTGVVPGRLIFSTANSSGTLTERMRINSEGSVGIGTTSLTGINFRLGKSITGGTTAYGMYLGGSVQSDVTSTGFGLLSQVTTAASAFTITNLMHFVASPSALGAGSTVSNQYGFYAESTLGTAGSATLSAAFGFYGNLAAASGRYNLYMGGTASNYLAGRFGVGATLNSGAMAQVTNTTAADVGLIVRGAASQTGDLLQIQNSSGTTLVKVDSTGNIGMGVSTALSSRITLVGTTNNSASALGALDNGTVSLISSNGAALNIKTKILFGFTDSTVVGNSAVAGYYAAYNGANDIGTGLIFGTQTNAAGGTVERMRIDQSGNVNIGTGTGGGTNTAGLSIAGKDIELMTLMGAF